MPGQRHRDDRTGADRWSLPGDSLLRRACARDQLDQGAMRARLEITRDSVGSAGDTKAALDVEIADADGRLAHANIWSQTNLAHALAIGRLPSDAPLEARFNLEQRPFEKLPVFFRPLPLSGRLEINGYAQGTIAQPFFVAEVRGSDLRAPGAPPQTPSLQLSWVTTYDLEDAASDIDLRIGEAHVARASLQLEASLAQVLGAPGDKPWSGGLYAEFDRFPLSVIPALAEREGSGALSGKVSISGIHRDPTAAAHLSVDDLRFGSDAIGPVAISFEANHESCLASLDAGRRRSGPIPVAPRFGRARVVAGRTPRFYRSFRMRRRRSHSTRRNSPSPRSSRSSPRFSVDSAGPSTLICALPGVPMSRWLDGPFGVTPTPETRPSYLSCWDAEIVRLDVQATADGSGTVHVPRFSGEMGSGSFTGQGSLVLRDNTVDHAHAELHVARRKAIPVTLEGVSYGTVWGDVIADGRVADGQLLVNLKAPTLRLELPPQRTGNLESMANNTAVLVLQPLSAAPPPTAVGGGPNPEHPHAPRIVLSVELGENVGVSRDDFEDRAHHGGPAANPKIALDGDVTIAGAIRILGGRVPVAGRVFRVERGIVTFGGADPDDPALDVDAVYEGPDTSITIKVHVGGSAKDLKLTLQSTPAKSQSEILSILTFGEAAPATAGPGGLAGPQQGGPSTVAGAAGSAAAGVGLGDRHHRAQPALEPIDHPHSHQHLVEHHFDRFGIGIRRFFRTRTRRIHPQLRHSLPSRPASRRQPVRVRLAFQGSVDAAHDRRDQGHGRAQSAVAALVLGQRLVFGGSAPAPPEQVRNRAPPPPCLRHGRRDRSGEERWPKDGTHFGMDEDDCLRM